MYGLLTGMEMAEASPIAALVSHRGGLLDCLHESDNTLVYAVDRIPDARDLTVLSRAHKGDFLAGQYFARHIYGGRQVILLKNRLKDPQGGEDIPILEKLLAARDAVQNLTSHDNPGWLFSTLARTATEWVGISQPPVRDDVAKRLVPAWHYQACLPGEYQSLYLYDLKGAYWQMTRRLPSPMLYIDQTTGKLSFCTLHPKCKTRWGLLLDALEPHKILRLAIVGNNAIGWRDTQQVGTGTRLFRNGCENTHYAPTPGPLQAASLLAVRLTYEACYIAWREAEDYASNPVYANADCIALEYPTLQCPVPAWSDAGLEYTLKASTDETPGIPAELRACSIYRIGRTQTGSYAAYTKKGNFCHTLPPKAPERLYFHDLLHP